jgi:polyhydroxybutyrate depolymerase
MPLWRTLFGAIKASAPIFAFGCAVLQAHAGETVAVSLQGIQRTALVYQPASLPAGPAPVIIALHGHGQTVESLRDLLHLDATADRGHFLAIYPEAVDGDWSYGRPIAKRMPAINGQPVDDLGFIRAIMDDLIASGRGDRTRFYIAGVSRGGLMAYTIACALAERIAGVAIALTSMTQYQREDCHPTKPVPIMVVAGTNDVVQQYDGWLAPAGRLLSVPETMEYWRLQNGCSKQDGKILPHRVNSDPTRVWLINWAECQTGGPLRLYRVSGGGHQMPSFTEDDDEMKRDGEADVRSFGLRNHDIETADEMWSFAKDFSR